MVGDGRRRAEMGGDGRGWSTAVGLLKNWKSSPRRKQRPAQHPAPRPLPPNPAPLTTPRGGPVACRALRRVRDHIHAYMSRARAAAFPHGARAVALGAVLRGWGLGASKSVRAGGSSADRNEGAVACGGSCARRAWRAGGVCVWRRAFARRRRLAPPRLLERRPTLPPPPPLPAGLRVRKPLGWWVGAVRAGNGVATPLHRIALGCSQRPTRIYGNSV